MTSLESVLVWQIIAAVAGLVVVVGGCRYVQHRADLRQLRRWARQDGVPLSGWRELRGHYAEFFEEKARP